MFRRGAAHRTNLGKLSTMRWWLRLQEKGGKHHEVPAHHNAEASLDAYLEAAGIAADKKGRFFGPHHAEQRR